MARSAIDLEATDIMSEVFLGPEVTDELKYEMVVESRKNRRPVS
jgi:hypothetical protein